MSFFSDMFHLRDKVGNFGTNLGNKVSAEMARSAPSSSAARNIPSLDEISSAPTHARSFGDGTAYSLDFTVGGKDYTFVPENVVKNGGVSNDQNIYYLPWFADAKNQKDFAKNAATFDLSGNAGLSKYLASQGHSTSGYLIPSSKVSFDSSVNTQPTSDIGGQLSGLKQVGDQVAYGFTGGHGNRYLTTSGEVHDPYTRYSSWLGDTFGGLGEGVADFVNSDLGKAALIAGTAYAGGAFDPSSIAGEEAGLSALDAGMGAYGSAETLPAAVGGGAGLADLAMAYDPVAANVAAGMSPEAASALASEQAAADIASQQAAADRAAALAADNIDVGGGWNPATGAGDAATAAAAAETGVTPSASTPYYDVPAPSAIDQLTQLAADNPLTTAGLAALAAPAVIGAQQPAQPEAPPPTPITYNINPYELQRTYNNPADMIGKQYAQGQASGERNWVTDLLTPKESYVKTEGKAAGGKISSNEGLMNLHDHARNLAAQGRYGDDTLVHMNRDEVAGLEALAQQHGKTLHTNPNTGYPEAFSLRQELGNATSGVGAPIIGAGLSVLSGGAIDPITAAAMVGGTQAVASGNLQKGLMAGLGAWGGASLGAGVMGMGQSALGAEAYNAANVAGATPEALQSAVSDKIASAGTMDTLKAGASAALSDPKAALAALGSGSAWKGAGVLGAAATPVLANQMVQTATPPPQSQGLIRPYQFNRKVVTPTDMVQPTYQQGQSTRERNWFEDTLTPNNPFAAPGPEYKRMAMGGDVQSDPNLQQVPAFDPVVRMAGGGLPALGGYASGGNPRLLSGPGDGMSDNIPAVIGGKQPARLADGEFVVPADVVSHLGNGSTDAGAKQLYKMMDRIRQQRTGKKKQAPEVNPTKAMPA